MTEFLYLSLAEADRASGTVVVIDVLRAFTTAAYAFHRGASVIYPVKHSEDAFKLKTLFPGAMIMGEVEGFKPDNFDFGNSPAEIVQPDLNGRVLIQRTSAGTRGIINSFNADQVLAASFVVAKSTANYLQMINNNAITFLITGASQGRDGDEDLACAEYIAALMKGDHVDPDPYVQRVWSSSVGKAFLNGKNKYLRYEDIEMSTKVNLFPFFLGIEHENHILVMKPKTI